MTIIPIGLLEWLWTLIVVVGAVGGTVAVRQTWRDWRLAVHAPETTPDECVLALWLVGAQMAFLVMQGVDLVVGVVAILTPSRGAATLSWVGLLIYSVLILGAATRTALAVTWLWVRQRLLRSLLAAPRLHVAPAPPPTEEDAA